MTSPRYFAAVLAVALLPITAQDAPQFTDVCRLAATEVRDQANSPTCWSFASVSFLESELIRTGKGYIDLSEMYVAHVNYRWKARRYVRLMGNMFLTGGGQPHDVLQAVRHFGLVPEGIYSGTKGAAEHNHVRLDAAMAELLNEIGEQQDAKLPANWHESADALLVNHLGELPQEFSYQGKDYTPASFARDFLAVDPDDYVQLTSYTHHPFHQQFCLESRYNWAAGMYHNVPLEQFMAAIDHALDNGYSVVWNGDVTEKTFRPMRGLATLPATQSAVTQELRQATFDDHSTTVDHVMHIIGRARDANGRTNYLIKNSWGKIGPFQGKLYMSEPYTRLKTVSIMLHRDAIPAATREKLHLRPANKAN